VPGCSVLDVCLDIRNSVCTDVVLGRVGGGYVDIVWYPVYVGLVVEFSRKAAKYIVGLLSHSFPLSGGRKCRAYRT